MPAVLSAISAVQELAVLKAVCGKQQNIIRTSGLGF